MYDVVIIGAGIIGATIARELSKLKLRVIVLEKDSDAACGASKANSGIIHAGHDCEPGSLKAKFNVEGNALYGKLTHELSIPFRRNGCLVLAFNEDEMLGLKLALQKAEMNKVPGVRIIYKDEILAMEKRINPDVYAALYAPTSGVISPYEAAIAFCESAFFNGVEFSLNTCVDHIEKSGSFYQLYTSSGAFRAKAVVNAAGIYSDVMNNYVSEKKYDIYPRKGEYMLFDRSVGSFVDKTIFQLPTELGKGVLIMPTIHDNLMIGPSAVDMEDKTSKDTSADSLKKILEQAQLVNSSIPVSKLITSFAGLRANLRENDDFVVEEAFDAPGFINCIGINSPGLSSAPAIAVRVSELLCERLNPDINKGFVSGRPPLKLLRDQSIQEQNRMIANDRRYGNIVCRCEFVTEGDIVDAINRPLGARNMDAVKRRVRAGMGRCQGGFCGSKVMEILANELDSSVYEITKSGGRSSILINPDGDQS